LNVYEPDGANVSIQDTGYRPIVDTVCRK
jgi:hypothetical protein